MVDESRAAKVAEAVRVWTGQLVDLGGRNTLLYYRDLKQGTLDLGQADAGAVAQVVRGEKVRLSALFPWPDTLAPAAKRARTVRVKAETMFEERGVQVLFLGWGMATWTTDRSAATPAAPVLLRPASFGSRGA